ncbi:MAG TPA: homoserine kinase [Blastocatellia bacterium]
MIRIRVPASTSNLGSGYDALGLAVGLYLTLEIEPSPGPLGTFAFEGEGAEELRSQAHENLIFETMRMVASREEAELKPARIRVHNQIPLARGLGSSGAAIVAGISAFEVLTGVALETGKIMAYAAEIEGHSDNVSAALLGSFVVSCMADSGAVLAGRIEWPGDIRAVVVIPDFMVRTHDARSAIPHMVPHREAVFNVQRSSLMVAAIATGRRDLIREAMKDRLHQQYRARLAPGLKEVLEFMENDGMPLSDLKGFLGLSLSGSGPTILALATSDFEAVASAISAEFVSRGIACRSEVFSIEPKGRVVERL